MIPLGYKFSKEQAPEMRKSSWIVPSGRCGLFIGGTDPTTKVKLARKWGIALTVVLFGFSSSILGTNSAQPCFPTGHFFFNLMILSLPPVVSDKPEFLGPA